MRFNPEIHHRRSIRLPGRDYSEPGAYFVTVCAWEKELLFGEIVNGEMRLNAVGQIVAEEWNRSAEIRREIELDVWVVMPNHLHGIVMVIDACRGDRRSPASEPTLEPTLGGGQTIRIGQPPVKGLSPVKGRPPVAPTGHPRGPQPTGGNSPGRQDVAIGLGPLNKNVGATGGRPPLHAGRPCHPRGPKPRSLSSFVAGFKSAATRRINQIRGAFGLPVWQRNYHEHIVRDEKELHRIRQYILDNPAQWALDQENPMAPVGRRPFVGAIGGRPCFTGTAGRPHPSKER